MPKKKFKGYVLQSPNTGRYLVKHNSRHKDARVTTDDPKKAKTFASLKQAYEISIVDNFYAGRHMHYSVSWRARRLYEETHVVTSVEPLPPRTEPGMIPA